MALIKLRNLPPSQPGDFNGQNLLAVALNDDDLDRETKTFSCGELISGMMMDFGGDAKSANFTESLTVSGESVVTGDISSLTSIGGEAIINEGGGGEIEFGGSDPSNKKDIVFTHGGAETMRVHDGGVNISPALTVNGNNVLHEGMNITNLTNNAGYITAADVPTNVSEFNNDAGYLSAVDLPGAISIGVLTLKNGSEDLGTFTSSTNATIDINVPKYNDVEAAFVDSDANLKDGLIRISNPIRKIERINGYNFIWNENADTEKSGEKDVGVVAQELESIIPEAVKEDKGNLKVAYNKIIPLLIECIKDQEKRIKKLEKK